jgi:hypothetical protein
LQAGMSTLTAEILVGHNEGLPAHYNRPTEQDLLNEYLKVVDNLSIYKQPKNENIESIKQ